MRKKLSHLVHALVDRHGETLVGVYLHGSLAMESYVPGRSDVDLLVVLEHGLSDRQRDRELRWLLDASASLQPGGLEISYLLRDTLAPDGARWPYDLHFGEMHRTAVEAYLAGDAARPPATGPATDGDLPGHVTVLRARGRALYGPPPTVLFPPVPRAQYLRSVFADLDESLEDLAQHPAYAALNLARTLRYLVEGAVGSKLEGGIWLMDRIPQDLSPALQVVMDAQTGHAVLKEDPDLSRLVTFLVEALNAFRPDGAS